MSEAIMVSTNCPYCVGYTDSAGFHHGFNCPMLITEEFGDWDSNKTPFGEVYDVAEKLKQENDALRKQLENMKDAIKALLAVLPDSFHPNNETWGWCWSELNEAACEEIKIARTRAIDALTEIEGGKDE